MNKEYGIIVLNYNGYRDTIACIESLLASEVKPAAIAIVNNASTDNSLLALSDWGRKEAFSHIYPACWNSPEGTASGSFNFSMHDPDSNAPPHLNNNGKVDVALIANPVNRGYAHGNNVGIRWMLAAGMDYIYLLNNDTIVHFSATKHLLERMEQTSDAGMCGTLIRYYDSPDTIQCYGGGSHSRIWGLSHLYGFNAPYQTDRIPSSETISPTLDFVYGASVFLRRKFIEDVGLLDERYFLYCEEQDWAIRAKNKWRLIFEPKAEVLHREGRSTGGSKGDWGNWRRNKILLKSRFRLAAKFHPHFLPTVLAGQCFAVVRKFVHRLARQ